MSSAADQIEARPDRPAAEVAPRTSRRDLLAWSLATSGFCLAGGAWRVLRSAPIGPNDLTSTPPFRLDTIPRALDGWKYVEASETQLDPMTTRITGSTDHMIRTYYDEMTGTAVSVLVLYGPAEPVLPHTPQACYPASGYRSLAGPSDHAIKLDDHRSATFRSGLFGKSGGRAVIRQLVYHSYRLDGVWSPDVTDRSLPRRWAGLFKVQVQRRVLDGERTDGEDPIESFLRQLLPELEKMIAAAPPATGDRPDPSHPPRP